MSTEEIRRTPPRYLSEPELAVYLDLCPRTVRTLRNEGRLPHLRIRDRIVYRLADIERAISSFSVPAKQ